MQKSHESFKFVYREGSLLLTVRVYIEPIEVQLQVEYVAYCYSFGDRYACPFTKPKQQRNEMDLYRLYSHPLSWLEFYWLELQRLIYHYYNTAAVLQC